ncbi:MAG: CoA transferase [Candidatus Tectomicrobia bacterium]|nr:CoA transferase [Candidatus Tectomicrobia bacterium]
MNTTAESKGALSHLRVLDLADEKGVYCAKLLADMGADIIKVEKPTGDPTRRFGPFVDDDPHPERSLFFLHYNTNKRGITLNIEDPEGQRLFKELVKAADVVVESFPPGYLANLGLAYEDLKWVNPSIVMASITPFGQYGPHAHYKGSEMVAWAMSGYMAILGYKDPELPPLNAPFFQCCHTASYYAAIGVLAAIYRRSITGHGQQIDTSMQEAMATMSESPNVFYTQNGVVLTRFWGYTGDPGFRRTFRCQDGYADISVDLFRPGGWPGFVEWMKSDDLAGDLEDKKWLDRGYGMAHLDQILQQIEGWTMTHTGYELFHEGQKRRREAAPINDIPAMVKDPHLNARGFFVEVEHPELGRRFIYPGAPYNFQETPWQIRRRAPLIGEHNLEIYEKELGLSRQQLTVLKESGVI